MGADGDKANFLQKMSSMQKSIGGVRVLQVEMREVTSDYQNIMSKKHGGKKM